MRWPAGGVPAKEAELPPLLAVVGPTASGKSKLALRLGEALGGEIVNTDSLQVYRYLDVGTAKPSTAEQARVPYHLLDMVEPDEPYSAGRYVAEARAAIRDIAARGRVPILCGGTGLYYRALLFGLADVPAVPREVQAAVEARVTALGSFAAYAVLARVDPEAARAVHPNDPVRVARALEVYEATGRPLSTYRLARPFRFAASGALSMGIAWEREALYARIERRVRAMLSQGWIDEVRGLLARGYDPQLKPLRAIGYREIAAWLAQGGEMEELARAISRRTRQYAKRQLTWFRRHAEIVWAPPESYEALEAAARKFLLQQCVRR